MTASNTFWDPIIKNLTDQWKALSNLISDKVDALKISKMLSIIKWMEYFANFLNRRIRFWTIPLSNVTRDKVT